MQSFTDASKKVGFSGQPLCYHDVVVALELEEVSVAFTVVSVGEYPFKMATTVVLLFSLEEHIPVLNI